MKSETDTSETDAAFAALAEIKLGSTMEEMITGLEKAHAMGRGHFERLERERDEARRERDELAEALLKIRWMEDAEIDVCAKRIAEDALAVLDSKPAETK